MGKPVSPWWGVRSLRVAATAVTAGSLLYFLILALSSDAASFAYVVASAIWAPLGLLLWFKRPEHPLGPLFTLVGLTSLAVIPAFLMGAFRGPFEATMTPQAWPLIIGLGVSGTYTWLLLVVIALFPDGRPATRPVRALVGLLVVAGFVATVAGFLAEPLGPVSHPFMAPGPAGAFREVSDALLHSFGVGLLLVVGFKVAEFRRAKLVRREQLKWLMYVLALYFVFVSVGFGIVGFEGFTIVGLIVDALLTGLIPAAMAVAILRYRLYEIDRLVSRTVTYALLVIVVAVVFAVPVVLLPARIGADNNLVIAVTTLTAAALFAPLRRRIQDRVDRRFNRARYDGVREVEALAARVNASPGADLPIRETLQLIERTLQPSSMSLWTKSPADV